jgi:hypothetical protein
MRSIAAVGMALAAYGAQENVSPLPNVNDALEPEA